MKSYVSIDLTKIIESSVWRELWPPITLFALYVLLLYNYWNGPTRLPFHDTLHVYETFAIAYNHFFETGALPRWLPYSNYGMPTYLRDIIAVPPFYLVTFTIGAALNVKNIWHLFLCAMAVDVAIFTLGSYLLARQFASRAAATVITAGMLLTLVLDWNCQLTLRLVTLMPLALFFLVGWAREASLPKLALAAVAVLLGCLGVPHYWVPFYAFFYLSCVFAFWVADRPVLRLYRSVTFELVAVFAVLLGAAISYLYLTSIKDLDFFAYARDPVTLKTDLSVFLSYGGVEVFKILEPFVAVPTGTNDAFFYAGGVTLVLSSYAFWRLRTRELWALSAVLTVFILFCWGPFSPVTRLAYYFPGMSYFRHVGLVYAVPKVLLGVIAAIGLDAALARLDIGRRDVWRVSYLIGVVSIIIVVAYFPLAKILQRSYVDWHRASSILLMVATVGGAAMVGLIFREAKRATIVPLLLLTTLGQGAVYQHFFRDNLYVPWQVPGELTHIHPVEFIETRDEGGIRKKTLYEDIAQRGATYPELNSFLQDDVCAPNTRVDYVARGVHRLMQQAFGVDMVYASVPQLFSQHQMGPSVARVVGCGVSKVQWVPAPPKSVTNSGKSPISCIDQALCVESPIGVQKAIPWIDGKPPAAPNLSRQGIVLDRFSFNDIAMSLTVDSTGWLVYADAFFPGWQAEVDGRSAPIWRANFAFKAVELEPGHHRVLFYFHDPVHQWTFWGIGVVGTAVILVLLIIAFRTGPAASLDL